MSSYSPWAERLSFGSCGLLSRSCRSNKRDNSDGLGFPAFRQTIATGGCSTYNYSAPRGSVQGTSMATVDTGLITAEEYFLLPDPGFPTELERGVVVMMSNPGA